MFFLPDHQNVKEIANLKRIVLTLKRCHFHQKGLPDSLHRIAFYRHVHSWCHWNRMFCKSIASAFHRTWVTISGSPLRHRYLCADDCATLISTIFKMFFACSRTETCNIIWTQMSGIKMVSALPGDPNSDAKWSSVIFFLREKYAQNIEKSKKVKTNQLKMNRCAPTRQENPTCHSRGTGMKKHMHFVVYVLKLTFLVVKNCLNRVFRRSCRIALIPRRRRLVEERPSAESSRLQKRRSIDEIGLP